MPLTLDILVSRNWVGMSEYYSVTCNICSLTFFRNDVSFQVNRHGDFAIKVYNSRLNLHHRKWNLSTKTLLPLKVMVWQIRMHVFHPLANAIIKKYHAMSQLTALLIWHFKTFLYAYLRESFRWINASHPFRIMKHNLLAEEEEWGGEGERH